jgi:cation:H+ antiporter
MIVHFAYLVIGGVVVVYAGTLLVDFAAGIAQKARLTPAVIGLTIVAAGTSTPELVVSLTAALQGSPAIAMGNVLGSNIANIGLILGACALIATVPVARSVLRFEYPFLVLASWMTLLLCRDGRFDRLESGFFFASMIAFTAYSVWVARGEISATEKQVVGEVVPDRAGTLSRRPTWMLGGGLLGSLVGLGLGARVMVAGAIGIAMSLGMSERVVGLTVVALGTSLPELAFSLAAALRQQQEMAVANIVGSNIFNLLMILGATGLAQPIPVDQATVSVDIWAMMGVTLLLLPLVFPGRNLSRRGGAALLASYVGYLAWLAAGTG